MDAKDIIILRRNENDTAFENLEVNVEANKALTFNALRDPVMTAVANDDLSNPEAQVALLAKDAAYSIFRPEYYNGVADGRIIYDAVFSNGSTAFTSATAAFTSADVGRTVVLQLSPTSRQVTTFASVTNATTAVLSVAATGANDRTYARGRLAFTTQPTAGHTVTIGATTYTFRASLSVANEVLIGAALKSTIFNLVSAINGAAGSGSIYGTGTVANASASATLTGSVATDSGALSLAAITAGAAGNAVATTETSSACAFENPTLNGGLDGSICYIGTDNTTPIQNAINAAAVNGGTVKFKAGIYIVAGAVNTSGGNSGSNAVLSIPYAIKPAPNMPITLEGEGQPNLAPWNLRIAYNTPNGQKLAQYGTVIYCPTSAATGGLAGDFPAFAAAVRWDFPQGDFGINYVAVGLVVKNLSITLRANPTLTAFQLLHVSNAKIEDVSIDTDYWPAVMPNPTTGASYGLIMPGGSNDVLNVTRNVLVHGFYHGIEFGEHTFSENCHIRFCVYAASFSDAPHSSALYHPIIEQCAYGFVGASEIHGAVAVQLFIYGAEFEDLGNDQNVYGATVAWAQTVANISDAGNRLSGFIDYHYGAVDASVGGIITAASASLVTGGSNLYQRLTSAPYLVSSLRVSGSAMVGSSNPPLNTLQTFGALKVGGNASQSVGQIALGDDQSAGLNVGIQRSNSSGVSGGNWLDLEGYDGVVVMQGAAAFGSKTRVAAFTVNGAQFYFKLIGLGGTTPIFTSSTAITSGAGVGAGTLTNAPTVGNPTKWIPIDDNGTIRYLPAW